MLVTALALAFVLAQDPAEGAEDPPSEAPAPAESAPAGQGAPQGGGGGAMAADPAIAAMRKQADELAKAASKLKDLSGVERDKAVEELRKKAEAVQGSPVLPPRDFNLEEYYALTDAEQALVVSRSFFEALLTGDAGRVADYAGVPFFLEDKRLDRPADLRATWAKHLRSKRTDLLALYGIEVFTPAEMEKRYGQPPARLKAWPWRGGPQQFLAVANLSGRAAIIVLKQAGSTWQVIAYHD